MEIDVGDLHARTVEFTATDLVVTLVDGRKIATPLDCDELDNSQLTPRRYTIGNIFRRLARKSDPWSRIGEHAHDLREVRGRLGAPAG